MRPALRKVGSLLLAVVIVSSMVGAPVGTAQAAPEDCTIGDIALGGLFTYLNPEDSCGVYKEQDTKDHLQARELGASVGAHQDSYLTTQENFASDRRAPTWSEAKLSIVNSLNQNRTEAEAQERANDSIEGYATPQVHNVLHTYGAGVSTAEQMWRANASWVRSQNGSSSEYHVVGFADYSYPLPNGNNTTIRAPIVASGDFLSASDTKDPDAYQSGTYYLVMPTSWEPYEDYRRPNQTYVDSSEVESSNQVARISNVYSPYLSNDTSKIDSVFMDENSNYAEGLYITGVNDSQENISVVDNGRYHDLHMDLWNVQTNTKDNVDSYINTTYQDYESGELSTDNILNPTDLASRASTQYNESGYYGFAAVELANLGYSGDFNSSVTVSMNNSTYEGYLFYTADDRSGWEVGETYDPSGWNGTVYLAEQSSDNQSGVYRLDQNFTIESAQNPKTGDAITNVTTQEYTQATYNSSKLEAQLKELRKLKEEYDRSYELAFPSGNVGVPDGPDTSGLPSTEKIIAALAIGGAVLLFLREN